MHPGTHQQLRTCAISAARLANLGNSQHVLPSLRGETVWNFNRPGTFNTMRLTADRFQTDMTGTVRVQPAQKESP